MNVLGFNIPTTTTQYIKGIVWLAIGGATGALVTWHGGAINWQDVIAGAFIPVIAFLHDSAQKAQV